MKKFLSVMSGLVCLSLITGCASVDKEKCGKAEKAEKAEKCDKAEKAAACPMAEKAKQEQDSADLAKRKELAEQLLIALNADKAVTKSFEELKKNQKAMMPRQLKGKHLQNPQEVTDALMGLMTTELTWEKCKGAFISSYAESFTVEELDALIKFHQSEIGKKLVDRQPSIHKKNYEAMRGIVMAFMPKADKLTNEIIEKQEKAAAAAVPAPVVAPAPVAAPAPAPAPAAAPAPAK